MSTYAASFRFNEHVNKTSGLPSIRSLVGRVKLEGISFTTKDLSFQVPVEVARMLIVLRLERA
jgi:hypothetical protein